MFHPRRSTTRWCGLVDTLLALAVADVCAQTTIEAPPCQDDAEKCPGYLEQIGCNNKFESIDSITGSRAFVVVNEICPVACNTCRATTVTATVTTSTGTAESKRCGAVNELGQDQFTECGVSLAQFRACHGPAGNLLSL